MALELVSKTKTVSGDERVLEPEEEEEALRAVKADDTGEKERAPCLRLLRYARGRALVAL